MVRKKNSFYCRSHSEFVYSLGQKPKYIFFFYVRILYFLDLSKENSCWAACPVTAVGWLVILQMRAQSAVELKWVRKSGLLSPQSYQWAIIQDLAGGNRVEGGVWWFAACVMCLTVGGQSQAGRVRDPMWWGDQFCLKTEFKCDGLLIWWSHLTHPYG